MKPISKALSALPVSAALAVDLRAKALESAGADVVSFCVGEPDFDTPAPICRAGIAAIEAGDTKYTPASGTAALKSAVCGALLRDCGLAYEPGQIAVTTGAKYAVYAAARALLEPGDEAILPAPYWTSYEHILRLTGARPVVVPTSADSGWKMTAAQLERAVTEKTKALILNNPNNPTGAVYTRGELEALMAVAQAHDLYVIADEIYSRLLYTAEPFCSLPSLDVDARERTVLVGGVSKAYAMTGWRIGYAAGNTQLIRAISAFLSHTTGAPNAMAQAAAVQALSGPQDDTERRRRTYLARRNCLTKALSALPGVRFTVPDGAFYVLMDVRALLAGGAWADEAAFAEALLEKAHVATVPGGDYGAPGCLRLSFTLTEARMQEGVSRMARFMEENCHE